MSLHRSLAKGDQLRRHRNVLTREERIRKLEQEGRWEEGESVLGLPKVRNIKATVRKKPKAVKAEAAAEAGAEGAEAGAEGAEGAAAGTEAASQAAETTEGKGKKKG